MGAAGKEDAPLVVSMPEAFGDLFKPYRYKAFYSGRGAAKSWSFAAALVLIGRKKSTRILCCRETQKSIRDSVKRLLDDRIEKFNLRGFYESTDTEIRGKNGTLFVFAGLRTHPDSIKSLEGIDIAWVEEANKVSRRSLEILIPTIRGEDSEIWFSWNPDFPTDPVDAMFRGDAPPPGSLVRQVQWTDNPWFPTVLRREMEWDKEHDPDKYAHIWLGDYQKHSESRVFKNWRVDALEVPEDARPYFGADWGFSVDPTVLVRSYLLGRTLYIDREVYRVGCEIDHTPALFAGSDPRWPNEHGFPGIEGADKWPITADSARPETISYMQRKGFRISPARKGPGSVEEGVEFLKSLEIVVHPDCTHVIDELSMYSYKVDDLTGDVLPVLEDRKNHCIAEGEMVLSHRGSIPIEDVKEGDKVWTRGGYQAVLFAGVTDVQREVVLVETTSGNSLRCTPDHEIWTQKGFVPAGDLSRKHEILCLKGPVWLRLWNGAGRLIADTQKATTARIASTSNALGMTARNICTETSGFMNMGQSPKVATSTILTATRSIMVLPILSALPLRSTQPGILGVRNEGAGRQSIWTESVHSPRHGTEVRKVERSTRKLVRWPIRPLSRLKRRVLSVLGLSFPRKLATRIVFVLTHVSPPGGGTVVWTMKSVFARSVRLCLSATGIKKPRLVRGRVRTVRAAGKAPRVYDLTVESHHEFVAGGVLVSNCIDAVRYSLEGVRMREVGMIFHRDEHDILEEPIKLHSTWPRAAAIDILGGEMSCVFGVFDQASDVIHIYAEYSATGVDIAINADAIRRRSEKWLPILFNHMEHGRGRTEGAQLASRLDDFSLNIFTVDVDYETQMAEMSSRLETARMRIAYPCTEWLNQYRAYRRDERGNPLKEGFGLMRATALLAMHGPQIGITENRARSDEEGFDPAEYERTQSGTGY